MVYNGLDISSWDSRIRKIVDKYGLEKVRFENWVELHDGNVKIVELEYLRHFGLRIQNDANSIKDDFACLEYCDEAEYMFNLMKELDPTKAGSGSWTKIADEYLKGIRLIREYPKTAEFNQPTDNYEQVEIGPYDDVEDHFEKIDFRSKNSKGKRKIRFR